MLTGLGDPSGVGEGFSFLREETKTRSGGGGASAANTGPKITGTDDDLRKVRFMGFTTYCLIESSW